MEPISGRTTACPVALAGVVTHVHVSCIGMRQKKDGKGWWEWRVLCKSKNEFQFLTSKKIARRKSKAELKQHNDVSNSFRSDTKMISKLKSHYLAISPSIVLDLDSWVVERNDETTSYQNKSGYSMQILLAYLPQHGSTVQCYHHHSVCCNYHFPPLLEERVRRSERNHVSLHQINGQT